MNRCENVCFVGWGWVGGVDNHGGDRANVRLAVVTKSQRCPFIIHIRKYHVFF